jgi:hypothetical protein
MTSPRVRQLSEELDRLMTDQVASLKKQVFGGLDKKELEQQEERLKRIREVSADLIAAIRAETS